VAASHVDRFEGGYRVVGTRVSLDSIVYAFKSGHSPETIARSFPVLTLEQVYGSIADCLGHRDGVDRYLEGQEQDYEAKREASRAADPVFYARLAEARRSPQRAIVWPDSDLPPDSNGGVVSPSRRKCHRVVGSESALRGPLMAWTKRP
jgi:hypothetical protein